MGLSLTGCVWLQELEKLDLYINSTLWGKELDGAGVPVSLQDHSSFGIRSSMFWIPLPTTNETGEPGYEYPPEDFTGWIWDRPRGDSLGKITPRNCTLPPLLSLCLNSQAIKEICDRTFFAEVAA